jgi:hypothetical protein
LRPHPKTFWGPHSDVGWDIDKGSVSVARVGLAGVDE